MHTRKENKQNFVSTFLEFTSALATSVPDAFLRSSYLYRSLRGSHSKIKIKTGIDNLLYRGYMKRSGDGFIVTPSGRKWFRNKHQRYFKLRQQVWDKKWRIILFDIPAELQSKRHAFRHHLRTIGAYMIQKSVFVFPYPCENEVAEWCDDLGLGGYVDVIVTDHIGSKEDYAVKHFNL